MKKKNENYDFDLMISSEDLKANKERILTKEKLDQKKLKKKKLKKFILMALINLLIIVGAIIFTNMLKNSITNWNYWSNKCDVQNGYTCSYYEVRQLMIRGE